ncbi:hypothetical protein [Nemorincola caseinilytica]
MIKQLALCALLCTPVCTAIAQTDQEKTTAYYNKLKASGDVARLAYFFSQMPKGGDLHHHYSGSVYLETYLDWCKDKGKYIDSFKYSIVDDTAADRISIDALRKNALHYRNLMSLWSTADFYNHSAPQVPPDQHFFNTFGFFSPISGNFKAGLAELKRRALQENVQYIETMLSSVSVSIKSTTYNASLYRHLATRDENGLTALFDSIRTSLAKIAIDTAVTNYISALRDARTGIDDGNFTMRYQTYANRLKDPSTVFISIYAAFCVAATDTNIVGVNFVGAENDPVSMKDFWLHMRMFRYFKSLPQFEKIHLALHAGELAPGMTRPEDMGYHIYESLTIAGAERIGHGVDLPYEDAQAILTHMAAKKNAIEINLTSNEFILGIKNERHPINMYHDGGVPLTISTDDAGVSRSSLTEQYIMLAERYTFTYPQIRSFVLNSIEHSFMNPYMKTHHKALLQRRFAAFEKMVAGMSK